MSEKLSTSQRLRRDGARSRIVAAYGPFIGPATVARQFDRCLQELTEAGVTGPGLVIAAERMAVARLRGQVRGGAARSWPPVDSDPTPQRRLAYAGTTP